MTDERRTDDRRETVRRRVQALDPTLVEAVDDVDRTLIAAALGLRPLERVRAASKAAEALARFRRAAG